MSSIKLALTEHPVCVRRLFMKLSEWVKTDERNQIQMAAEVGVHHVTFSRWVKGKSVPSKRKASALRRLTNDQVTLSDFHQKETTNGTTEKE